MCISHSNPQVLSGKFKTSAKYHQQRPCRIRKVRATVERSKTESKNTMSPKVKEKTCQITSTHRSRFSPGESLNSKNSIVTVTPGQNSLFLPRSILRWEM